MAALVIVVWVTIIAVLAGIGAYVCYKWVAHKVSTAKAAVFSVFGRTKSV